MKKINYLQIYFLVFLISLVPKILIIIYFPPIIEGNDQETYLRIARNILSGCGISSDPDTNNCSIESLGPKMPGYPILLAVIMMFSESSYFLIKIFNAFVLSFSIIYFLSKLKNFIKSKYLFLILGIILSLSPISLPWSRFILTESMSIAITLIIFAELFQLVQNKKLNILRFSLFLIIATFIRIDLFLLFIPITIAIIISYQFNRALKNLVIILLIFSIPWTLWLARNYHYNLQIFPYHMGFEFLNTNTDIHESNLPEGYVKWTNTWIVNEYELASAWNPLGDKKYKEIFIDFENIKLDEDLKKESKQLLNELIIYSGQPIPKTIDNEFRKIAQLSIKRNKFNYYVILPFKRMIFLWSNLTNSNGWPTELHYITHEERIKLLNSNFKEKIEWILDHLGLTLSKIIPNFWRLTILMIFLISIVINLKENRLKNFTLVIFSYFVAKNLFSGYANFIELRYFVNLISILEIICCLSIINIIERKKANQ